MARTELGSLLQDQPPRYVRHFESTVREVLRQIAERSVRDIALEVTAKHREADAVHDLRPAVQRDRQRAPQPPSPSAERARLAVVNVHSPQRAGIHVGRLSARHARPRQAPATPPPRAALVAAPSIAESSPVASAAD